MSRPREEKATETRLVENLIKHLAKIPRKPGSPRRSAVAIIIRIRPNSVVGPLAGTPTTRDPVEFLKLDWVKSGEAEVLFVRRAANENDRWSGHMAFPGGKADPNETDQHAAERECIEEIGLDLNSAEYTCLGALDDRNVTPAASTKPVLILSPYVYLQLVPVTPPLILLPEEIASIHWIPLSFFLAAARNPSRWRPITFPIARHLLSPSIYSRAIAPTSPSRITSWRRAFHIGLEKSVSAMFGKYRYFGVLLPTAAGEIVTPLATPTTTFPTTTLPSPRKQSSSSQNTPHQSHHSQNAFATHEVAASSQVAPYTGQSTANRLLLWGLTLWMTSDLMDMCSDPADLPTIPLCDLGMPKYSHPDVDWCFGLLARNQSAFGGTVGDSGSGGSGGEGRTLPQRKPAVSVTIRKNMEIYHAIRISVLTALTFRAAIAWLVVKSAKKAISWLKNVR
ncbi:hypothetical protein HDU88_003543 [Geranomyces variabilis]|nr:hypothetical protein HDU88_003543 [Geranomyces variabilis]